MSQIKQNMASGFIQSASAAALWQWLSSRGGWLWILSVLTIAGVAFFCGYGLDFTDEGYYLAWIYNPTSYTESLTQFGFIYHPIFKAVGFNLHIFRTLALLGNWIVAALCFHQLLSGHTALSSFGRLLRWGLSLAFATAVLAYYHTWLPTPNYNLLCMQGLLLCILGILRYWNQPEKPVITTTAITMALIGLGGTITFLAKPSSGAVLAPIVILTLLMPFKPANIASGIQTTLGAALVSGLALVAAAVSISGNIPTFAKRMLTAYSLSQNSNLGHELDSIIRLDPLVPDATTGYLLVVVLLFTILGAYALLPLPGQPPRKLAPWLVLVALILTCSAIFLCIQANPKPVISPGIGLLMFAIPLAGIIMATIFPCLISMQGNAPSVLQDTGNGLSRVLFQAGSLMLLPWVYSFGTNTNLWNHSASAAVFWVMATLLLVNRNPNRITFTVAHLQLLAGITLFCSTFLAFTGIASPYRQPAPLWHNSQAICLFQQHSRLRVHSWWANYIEQAHHAVTNHTPHALQTTQPIGIIDLTGHSPTLIMAMGGYNVGRPWIIGGYPGSTSLAKAVLDRIPCSQLAQSYLLTEPNGYRHLPGDVAHVFGADISRDFKTIGQWSNPRTLNKNMPVSTQQLHQPKNPGQLTQQCLNLRRSQNRQPAE